MPIKVLKQSTISKIAAGEVIERPASVVKELVENSIDAGSTFISIKTEYGGRNLIEITDNGHGILKEDLDLAFVRHATSKLQEDDLDNIEHFGFRGEALASIASVSRVQLVSGVSLEQNSYNISCESGEILSITPAPAIKGTKISVRDLFCKTPMRLKFLQKEKMENQYITKIIKTLAIAHNNIEFILQIDGKIKLHYKPETAKSRVLNILNIEDPITLFNINLDKDGYSISGYAAVPHITFRDSSEIYTYVNRRAIENDLLIRTVRSSYYQFIEKGKYPKAALLISAPNTEIDVNVHPNKLDIRFQHRQLVVDLISKAIQNALRPTISERFISEGMHSAHDPKTVIFPKKQHVDATQITETNINDNKGCLPTTEAVMHKSNNELLNKKVTRIPEKNLNLQQETQSTPHLNEKEENGFKNFELKYFQNEETQDLKKLPLGSAICQINRTYILAETYNELIFIDQHAAHERIIYEQLKESIFHPNKVLRQRLLIPEKIRIDDEHSANLLDMANAEFSKIGFLIEKESEKIFFIVEKPSFMTEISSELIMNCLSVLHEFNRIMPIEQKIHEICSMISCCSSIRAGRVMNKVEMNSLLRKIESTQHTDQCNHGRPSHYKLSFSKIASMFHR